MGDWPMGRFTDLLKFFWLVVAVGTIIIRRFGGQLGCAFRSGGLNYGLVAFTLLFLRIKEMRY
jgi:hypothetical protein